MNKIEFVGNIEPNYERCGCCSSVIQFEDIIKCKIQPFQNHIFTILFENIQLSSDTICESCNHQLINIHKFQQDVKEKLNNFKLISLEPTIKVELEFSDVDDTPAAFDFVKSESPEHDYEEQSEVNPEEVPKIKKFDEDEIFEPRKKRARKPPNEVNDGKRKGGITYNCCLCKVFTSDNKKEYSEHILEKHALNYHKSGSKADKDPRSKMIESKPLPEPKGSVQCDYCGGIYTSRKSLYAHMKIHLEAKNQVICVDCKKPFRDLRVMVRHQNKEHGKGVKFWCYCGNVFDNVRDLNRCRYAHGRNKIPEKLKDTCEECRKSFSGPRPLLNHKNKYHSNGTRFWCVRCGIVYNTRDEQVICIKSHYTDVLKDIMIKCPQCQKELLHNSLKIHMKSVHSEVREIVCHECGKAFCAVARLTVHMRQVHNNGHKPWICDFCDRSFAQKKSVRDHILKVHATDKKNYQCPICLKICQDVLDRHMTLVHPNGYDNGVRANPETNLYHCPKCIQTFHKMKAFEWHVNENLCENYGECEVDESLTEGGRLSVFTKGKFKCKLCNSVQKTIARLRRHQHYVHSGEVNCPVCDKKMKCKRAVIGHLRKVHKTNYTEVTGNSRQVELREFLKRNLE